MKFYFLKVNGKTHWLTCNTRPWGEMEIVSTAMKTHFNIPAEVITILINITYILLKPSHGLKACNTTQPSGY